MSIAIFFGSCSNCEHLYLLFGIDCVSVSLQFNVLHFVFCLHTQRRLRGSYSTFNLRSICFLLLRLYLKLFAVVEQLSHGICGYVTRCAPIDFSYVCHSRIYYDQLIKYIHFQFYWYIHIVLSKGKVDLHMAEFVRNCRSVSVSVFIYSIRTP